MIDTTNTGLLEAVGGKRGSLSRSVDWMPYAMALSLGWLLYLVAVPIGYMLIDSITFARLR